MEGAKRRIEVLTHQLSPPLSSSTLTPLPTSQVQYPPTHASANHHIQYPPPHNEYDVIIIGGGVHGTATAEVLSRKKQKVLLLEQFTVNHEEGSSHGDGRIIRFLYPETIYTQMAKIGHPMWQDIEERYGSKVTQYTGGITFGPENDPDLALLIENLTSQGLPIDIMTPEETSKRFPMFRIPPGNKVVYQKDSGVAFASKAVKALWELAARQGATLLEREKAVNIHVVNDNQVVVSTQSGKRFTGTKLIITAGAWAKDLLLKLNLDLPLVVTEEQVFYWEEKQVNLKHHMNNMPVFIVHGEDQFYGLPQIDVPGVKIGWHHSGSEINADSKAKFSEVEANREKKVSKFVEQVFPELAHQTPCHKLYCLYTTTPDHHFVIDRHPVYSNVIIGSPCSGHGFKFAPVVGALLAGLALNEKLPFPVEPFKISRFSGPVVKRTGV